MSIRKIVDKILADNPYMGWNNISRAVFKEIRDKYNLEQIEGRKGNYFLLNGKPYAFTVTTKKGKSECRQYYSDIKGLICYNDVDNQINFFDGIVITKQGYNLGNQSRKAQTALMDNTKYSRITTKEFDQMMKGA